MRCGTPSRKSAENGAALIVAIRSAKAAVFRRANGEEGAATFAERKATVIPGRHLANGNANNVTLHGATWSASTGDRHRIFLNVDLPWLSRMIEGLRIGTGDLPAFSSAGRRQLLHRRSGKESTVLEGSG